MIGQDGVVALAMQSLSARIEARLAVLDTELGPLTVPDGHGGTVPCVAPVLPVFISDSQIPFDGVPIDSWPFILTIPQADPTMARVGIDPDGAYQYDVRYEVRFFIWVRGDDYPSTARVQRRLTQGVKEVMLIKQALSPNVKFDEDAMAVRYSELVASEDINATIGASMITAFYVARERLAPAAAPFGPTQGTFSSADPLSPAVVPTPGTLGPGVDVNLG